MRWGGNESDPAGRVQIRNASCLGHSCLEGRQETAFGGLWRGVLSHQECLPSAWERYKDSSTAALQRAGIGPRWEEALTRIKPRREGPGSEKARKQIELRLPEGFGSTRRHLPGTHAAVESVVLTALGELGLQLPAVLAATSLAPPTTPRVLHASGPERGPRAPAYGRVRLWVLWFLRFTALRAVCGLFQRWMLFRFCALVRAWWNLWWGWRGVGVGYDEDGVRKGEVGRAPDRFQGSGLQVGFLRARQQTWE